jgi:tetratricopeptide (TPR) repeat protein
MRTIVLLFIAALVSPAYADAQRRPTPNADLERAQLHFRVGWESLNTEAWERAVKEFQQALDLNPKCTVAYYGLGKAYMGLRQYPKAVAAFSTCRDRYVAQAGERFGNEVDANRHREDRFLELQDLSRQYAKGPQTMQAQDAQRQIQNAIQRTQEAVLRGATTNIDATAPAFVLLALGSAYFRGGQMADAEREYKTAVRVDPSAGEAHNNLAVVYMLTGRLQDAIAEVALAEKAGFRVNPQFKEDLKKAFRQH